MQKETCNKRYEWMLQSLLSIRKMDKKYCYVRGRLLTGSVYLGLKLIKKILTLYQGFCSVVNLWNWTEFRCPLRCSLIILSCYWIDSSIISLLLLFCSISKRISMNFVAFVYYMSKKIAMGTHRPFFSLFVCGVTFWRVWTYCKCHCRC